MTYLLLAAGLTLLIVGGDLLVRASVAGAVRLAISPMVIGLTIVAFGTSAPELLVSVDAALQGLSGLAIGNVVGSNIANILLVLGLPSMIAVTECQQPFGKRNASFLLASTLVFIILCFQSPLTLWHGGVLLILLLVFFAMSLHSASDKAGNGSSDEETAEMMEGARYFVERPVMMLGALSLGLGMLPLGAHLTVESAKALALQFGVSDRVIGLSIVALGTSLPEIVTTVIAALRGQSGLALGNAIGSCVFNLLAILGITALVAPLTVPESFFQVDMWLLIATATLPLFYILSRRDMGFLTGALFVLVYTGYMASLFFFDPKYQNSAERHNVRAIAFSPN